MPRASFTSQPQLEVVPPGPNSWRPLPRVRLGEGARPESVIFGALGYAEAAVASYRVFARLKRDGLVPVACRFQVCLPTPVAPISAFVVPEHQGLLERIYEDRLLGELRLILQPILIVFGAAMAFTVVLRCVSEGEPSGWITRTTR